MQLTKERDAQVNMKCRLLVRATKNDIEPQVGWEQSGRVGRGRISTDPYQVRVCDSSDELPLLFEVWMTFRFMTRGCIGYLFKIDETSAMEMSPQSVRRIWNYILGLALTTEAL